MWTQNWQAYQYINERQTARGKTLRKDEQTSLLTKVCKPGCMG